MSTAARNAASISKWVVSSKCASGAGFSGAVVRPMSRSSRALDVGQHLRLLDRARRGPQFQRAAARPHLGRCGDEDFHVGVGEDDRADVAAVEHGAGRRRGELALECQQRRPHLRDRGDHARPPRRPRGPSARPRRTGRDRAPPRDADGGRDVVERLAPIEQRPSPPRGRSGRCRDGAARSARRAACRACPCRTPPARRWR